MGFYKNVITQIEHETSDEESWKIWWKERPFGSCIYYRSGWQMISNVIFHHVAFPNISSQHFFILYFILYSCFSLSLHHSSCRGDWRTVIKSRPSACWRPSRTLNKADEIAQRFCSLPNLFTATFGRYGGQQLVQQGCNVQTSYEWNLIWRNTNRQGFHRYICCSVDWNAILYWPVTIGRASAFVNWVVMGNVMNTRDGLQKRKGGL